MLISTFSSEAEAKKIAKILLKERLIACANIIPSILSLYWWNDEIQEESEVIFFLKTSPDLEEKVIKRIKDLHSYDVPAIYAIPSMDKILSPYKDWILKETEIDRNK